jgi:hypothetical protein
MSSVYVVFWQLSDGAGRVVCRLACSVEAPHILFSACDLSPRPIDGPFRLTVGGIVPDIREKRGDRALESRSFRVPSSSGDEFLLSPDAFRGHIPGFLLRLSGPRSAQESPQLRFPDLNASQVLLDHPRLGRCFGQFSARCLLLLPQCLEAEEETGLSGHVVCRGTLGHASSCLHGGWVVVVCTWATKETASPGHP